MVNLLHNAVRIALATPEVREQFRGAAVDACGMPPMPGGHFFGVLGPLRVVLAVPAWIFCLYTTGHVLVF
jgi:hypothetical protein